MPAWRRKADTVVVFPQRNVTVSTDLLHCSLRRNLTIRRNYILSNKTFRTMISDYLFYLATLEWRSLFLSELGKYFLSTFVLTIQFSYVGRKKCLNYLSINFQGHIVIYFLQFCTHYVGNLKHHLTLWTSKKAFKGLSFSFFVFPSSLAVSSFAEDPPSLRPLSILCMDYAELLTCFLIHQIYTIANLNSLTFIVQQSYFFIHFVVLEIQLDKQLLGRSSSI